MTVAAGLKKLIIMGGEGGGTIVASAAIEAAAAGAGHAVLGFLNDKVPRGQSIYGLPVLGRLEDWRLQPDDTAFNPALHNFAGMQARFERILSLGVPPERWATVRHPLAVVARDVQLGYGSYVGPFAVIEPGAKIGNFVCVRPGAYVSHETSIGDFVFVGANSTIAGRTRVGRGTHVGPNAAIRDRLTIAEFTTIGIGAVITTSVLTPEIVAGNPGRTLPRRHAPA
jgi:acetyltransferase EpsM